MLCNSERKFLKEEIEFYNQLRSVGRPGDVVLEVPVIDRYSPAEISGWFYRSTPRVAAFSGKRTFFGSEVVQFPYDEWIHPRIRLLSIFLLGQAEALKALQTFQEKYSIDFIVIPKGVQPWFVGKPWLRFVFGNEYATIYQMHGLPE